MKVDDDDELNEIDELNRDIEKHINLLLLLKLEEK